MTPKTECHYAESRYAECRKLAHHAVCLHAECRYSNCCFAVLETNTNFFRLVNYLFNNGNIRSKIGQIVTDF
jgi:hypothetical protein